MNLTKAKAVAAELFGRCLLVRQGGKCWVFRDGQAMGDGNSWLEALRDAGKFEILRQGQNKEPAP